jgi:hypothetical protein
MSLNNDDFDDAVAELREQGLIVSIHNASNETFFVKGKGLYVGYIATRDELLELKVANRLNIRGIESLG